MKMTTIALLTDFGVEDSYVGVLKGTILNINENVHLVDITHAIKPQDVAQAASTLKAAYKFFPPKTIFVCVVDPGVGSDRKPIIVKTRDYIFVGPDNGLLTQVIEEEKGIVYTITSEQYFLKPVSRTFHGRDIFAPVAAHLAKGVSPAKIGERQAGFKKLAKEDPKVDRRNRCIIGQITEIDRFGNLITNVKSALLKGDIIIKIKSKVISRLNNSYAESEKGELLAIIGSQGFLELAVNHGSAAELLRSKIGDTVKIEWKTDRKDAGQKKDAGEKPVNTIITPFDFYQEMSKEE